MSRRADIVQSQGHGSTCFLRDGQIVAWRYVHSGWRLRIKKAFRSSRPTSHRAEGSSRCLGFAVIVRNAGLLASSIQRCDAWPFGVTQLHPLSPQSARSTLQLSSTRTATPRNAMTRTGDHSHDPIQGSLARCVVIFRRGLSTLGLKRYRCSSPIVRRPHVARRRLSAKRSSLVHVASRDSIRRSLGHRLLLRRASSVHCRRSPFAPKIPRG
jgi:hypothetical protein